jgi:hypothetical protein
MVPYGGDAMLFLAVSNDLAANYLHLAHVPQRVKRID